jgi:monovalent cation/hydrogen antiporter
VGLSAALGLGALAVIVVTAYASRIGVAAPLVLVLVGVLASLVPGVPTVEVDPEIILAGILPPLLYSAAVSMPTMDFRRDFKVIGGLSVLLVAVTAVALGYLFFRIIPGINLATGIALGAVVSPTDPVATSIVRGLGVSPRIVAVLEGESLLNDASALVILRSAVAAVVAGSVSIGYVGVGFVYAVVMAVLVGWLVGRVGLWVRAKLRDAVLTTAASFVVPFAAYLPAEALHASGLVAVVVAGLVAGAGGPHYLRPQDRRTEDANWHTVEALLEGSVFLIMGLELEGLIRHVHAEHGSVLTAVWIGVLAWAALVAVRAVYVVPLLAGLQRDRRRLPAKRARLEEAQERLESGERAFPEAPPRDTLRGRWWRRRRQIHPVPGEPHAERRGRIQRFIDRRLADIDYLASEHLGPREGVLLVWAGMRGVVTLAAAQSLPRSTPQRSLLILVAFLVAAGSLLLQGGTLRPVVRRLKLSAVDPEAARAEYQQLIAELAQVAADACDQPDLIRPDGTSYDPQVVRAVRAISVRMADEEAFDVVPGTDSTRYDQFRELRIQVIRAEREALLAARSVGSYSSEALDQTLKILDADEIGLQLRGEPGR